MSNEETERPVDARDTKPVEPNAPGRLWIYDLLLILVLFAGAYFRTIGLNWDDNQHLHPDERFLTMVETSLMPASTPEELLGPPPTRFTQPWRETYSGSLRDCKEWGGLFDTACSPMNPNNRGYGFYVYGDLPIIGVRYIGQALTDLKQWAADQLAQNQTSGMVATILQALAQSPDGAGYDGVQLVGRQLSALADLLTILLMYLSASRLYGRKVALLTAAFSAFAVLQIQISHFFTVETTTNLFLFAAIYFAVRISTGEWQAIYAQGPPDGGGNRFVAYFKAFVRDPLLWATIGFGVAQAAAMASKISAFPMVLLLPAAFGVLYARMKDKRAEDGDGAAGAEGSDAESSPQKQFNPAWLILAFLVIGGAACVLAFRIFQPYAFVGLRPNQAWIDQIRQQRIQASGDVDFPPALQWADRPITFAGINMVLWGLGIPLGILALLGYAWMGWRILHGEWKEHILLWGWMGFYFVWQSLQLNPTMRYFMPIYPLAAMMAAWFLVRLAHTRVVTRRKADEGGAGFSLLPLAIGLGVIALGLTMVWAFAFTRIYTRPHTRVAASEWIYQNVPGPITLPIAAAAGETVNQQIPFPYGGSIPAGFPFEGGFVAAATGTVDRVLIKNAVSVTGTPSSQTLNAYLSKLPYADPAQALATGTVTSDFAATDDARGESYTIPLDKPVQLEEGQVYYLDLQTPDGFLRLSGSAPTNESSWDDPLPLRMGGYDGYGGLYEGDLNQELYWDDNADKLNLLIDTLDRGDYVFISSDRQWATTTRVPQRYPLTTAYYRALIGCPPERDIIWCYNVAKPGQFQGQLGYDLQAVFESYPTLGNLQVNDQFAEEAFTVYDHPKVLIFKKSPDYEPGKVREILGAVDLSRVVHVLPGHASSSAGDLMLPSAMLALQRTGGTWSQLFDLNALQNRYPYLGLVLWYLTMFALGLFVYPFLRMVLPGLNDRGYPLARISGLLIWSYLAWLAGSVGIPYSRLTIGLILLGLALIGAVLAFFQRRELAEEWRHRWRYFLIVEGLFLGMFLLDLLIRLGNPDLWHPARGGERPMDFSYLNAVIKSTVFPPYDPWFAGGYINYYYYGFVLVGTPIKFLGIVPSVAYNLVLPTLYAMLAVGGFSLVWNLVSGGPEDGPEDEPKEARRSNFDYRFWAALAASAALVLLGNLGVPRMIYQGFIRLAAPDTVAEAASGVFQRLGWAAQGLVKVASGETLPYGPGDWYWNPSRVIPAPNEIEPITEFPLFTFIYSDLHAHMIALPLTLLALAWALSVVLAKARWRNRWALLASFVFGGLAIGSLRPTNTWDLPTYLALGSVAVVYAVWRYAKVADPPFNLPPWGLRMIYAAGGVALLAGFSWLLFQPFAHWYGQAYGTVDPWQGSHTPLTSYVTHWGLFLFAIVSWMTWETHEWLATTPVSALGKLRPYLLLIVAGILSLFGLVALLLIRGASVTLLALPFAAWAGVLLLRPGLHDSKRVVLFMVGTALVLTVVVELVVLRGDIARMNTVFKFYLQVWVLLGIAAAASLGWLLPELPRWNLGWRTAWETTGIVLIAGASMFLLMGGMGKIRDRWAETAPHSLDSMAYMPYTQYGDQGVTLDLRYDYEAIRWMQQNVQGSPVLVEANCVEYHWCTRFTIYTGLPGVIGWNWHQRQQRAVTPSEWITDRVVQIGQFYLTSDPGETRAFLDRYDVEYIIVGELERAYYPGIGLDKFAALDGILWDKVYDNTETQIYKVK
jgi:YYY domain-containing protein